MTSNFYPEANSMKAYFVNPDTSRLRAGWRLLIFLCLFFAITAAGMVGVREMLGSLKKGSLLQFVIIGVTAAVSVYIARTKLDKRTFQSLGLKWNRFAALDLLMGVGNSALVMATVFLLLLGLGLIEFNGFSICGMGFCRAARSNISNLGGLINQLHGPYSLRSLGSFPFDPFRASSTGSNEKAPSTFVDGAIRFFMRRGWDSNPRYR